MPGPTSPPPGSIPSGMMSPDMQSTMAQMMGGGGKGKAGGSSPFSAGGAPNKSQQQRPPRPVGSLPQEAKYMTEDVMQGLLSVLPDFMQQILGVKPTDTPEEVARKKQMLQRYHQMNDEQQQVVQKQMKEAQDKKKKEEEERVKKEQEAKQKAEQDELPMPQGKSRGEGTPGMSNKQRTLTKLQKDRQTLSSAG